MKSTIRIVLGTFVVLASVAILVFLAAFPLNFSRFMETGSVMDFARLFSRVVYVGLLLAFIVLTLKNFEKYVVLVIDLVRKAVN